MLMFIIYALLLFIIGNGIGKIFIKKDSKIYSLRSVIGFGIFLGVLQVLFFPLEYFKLSSNYLFISLVVSILFLGYGLKEIKKEDFFFLKDYRFYILLILFFGIMKIIPSVDATDDEFYFPFIIDNAFNKINTINPETGLSEIIGPYHSYQGYYLLISFMYRIQHFIFNSIDDIYVVFRSTFTLLFAIFFSNILSFIKEINKKEINKYVLSLLLILSVLLIGIDHLNHIYYGSFVLFSVFIPLFIILMNNYIENKNIMNTVMIIFIELGLMSLASSSLFLILMIISITFAYEVIIGKNVDITYYLGFILPVIIYVGFMFNLLIIPLGLILLFLIKLGKNFFNEVLSKYGKYVVYIVPFIFILGSIYLKGIINISLFSKAILLFNTLMLLLILYLVIIKKKKINFYIFSFLLTIIIYYNPLTSTFVSRYLTTADVFYRISFITKNPLIITSIFIYAINGFDKKIFKYGLYVFIVGLSLLYARNIYTLMISHDDYFKGYNYLLRESKDNLDLGYEVSKLEGKVVSLDYSARIYNPNLEVKLYRFLELDIFDDVKFKVLFHNADVTDEFKSDIKDYDYIISQNRYNHNLNNYYDIIYHNDTYTLYKVG